MYRAFYSLEQFVCIHLQAFADQSGDENSVNIQQDGGSDRCLNESNANNVPVNISSGLFQFLTILNEN